MPSTTNILTPLGSCQSPRLKLTCLTDHFTRYAPEHIEYGVNRYQNETRRLYSVLNTHLTSGSKTYLVGEKCTIAGML
jgi:glutathione S-transferase